jgi:hypothetical protein
MQKTILQVLKEINNKKLSWDKTPNFNKNGVYSNLKNQCDNVCGDRVFGKKKGLSDRGVKSIISFLKRSCEMDIYNYVPEGDIISEYPTREELILKLEELGRRALKYYSKYPQTLVTDRWSIRAKVRDGEPLNINNPKHRMILDNPYEKRFIGKEISVEEQVIELIMSSTGMISEGYVIAFLNSNIKCPVCKVSGKIGWCDGVSHRSVDAFRDAVCMNCRDNGVITLFEIKTRWEKHITKDGTYGGNFTALNVLMCLQANIYLVIASRDTGEVRIGRITSAKIRGNRNWLYSIQEDMGWGSPSSYIKCSKGFYKLPKKMPVLIDVLPESYCQSIYKEVLSNLGIE